MSIIKKWFFIVSISMVPVVLLSAGFTKTKATSNNQLKDLCAQGAGDILKQIPVVLTNMAEIQTGMVTLLEDLIEGNSQGFWAKATKGQLEERQQKLEPLNKKIADFNQEIRKSIKELK